MSQEQDACVLHAERAGKNEALGHRLCGECFDRYRVERREQQAFKDRKFLQEILRAGYELEKEDEYDKHPR